MRTRLLALALAITALTSCTMFPEKRPVKWHHASGGEQLEHLFWESVQHKDWQPLEAHLSITFTGLIDGRTLDRAAMLDHLKATDLKAFTLSELTVTPNGNTMTVAYLFNGQPGAGPVRFMTVWQHQKSGWIAIAHAESSATRQ
jgi:hypothetical protein